METTMADNYEQEWQNFLTKMYTYAEHNSDVWTPLSLLSYFLVKYKAANGLDFMFTPTKKGPTNTREMKEAVKLWKMFDRGKYNALTNKEEKLAYKEQLVGILKAYIDWAFNVKFRGKERNVTSLALFVVASFTNEFLQWRKARRTALPRRNDPLPSQVVEWIETNAAIVWKKQQLAVLDDLNALFNYVEAYDPRHISIEAVVLEKAREMGIMPKQGRMELNKK